MRSHLKFPEIRIGYWGADSDTFYLVTIPLITIFRGDTAVIPFSILQSVPNEMPLEYYTIVDPEITIELYQDTFYVADELVTTQYGTVEGLANGHFKWVLDSSFTETLTRHTYGIWVKNADRTFCKFLLEIL